MVRLDWRFLCMEIQTLNPRISSKKSLRKTGIVQLVKILPRAPVAPEAAWAPAAPSAAAPSQEICEDFGLKKLMVSELFGGFL